MSYLNALLKKSPDTNKISLSNATEETVAKTYDEWVEIHGEPQEVIKSRNLNTNHIKITNCSNNVPIKNPTDTSKLFYNKKEESRNVNPIEWAKAYMKLNKLAYCNGQFYTPDGAVSIGKIKSEMTISLDEAEWKGATDRAVTSIVNTLQNMSYVDEFKVNPNLIPFANGDLYIDKYGEWEFKLGDKSLVPYRLSVDYTPTTAPTPLFDKWLHDVFEDEDIITLQEIFGYLLVPVTAAQEAFFIVGNGGVGKSVIGIILQKIFGNAFAVTETKRMAENQFRVAVAENKLVIYDDDIAETALSTTSTFKQLITANTYMTLERKHKDPVQFLPFCKIVACANFMLTSLYDDSDGFYRRLHPIKVKKKDSTRKIISGFGNLIVAEEAPQIVNWALVGLRRLIDNDWKITWSKRSRDYMNLTKGSAVHFPDFISETLDLGKGDISSKELQRLYERWCKENSIQEVKSRRLQTWFNENSEKYKLKNSNHIIRQEKHVRGYLGAAIKPEWENLIRF